MRLRTSFVLALLASGLACKSTTATSTPAYVGTYTLTMANGSPLPYTQTLNGVNFTLNSGTAQLFANGNWSAVLNVTPSFASSTPSGTYTVSGSTITFTKSSDGSQNAGTYTNNTLTVVFSGSPPQTLTFTKN
jgi:hypothetical protein